MGWTFPYLDAKEVYDLLLYDSQEWLLLKQPVEKSLLAQLKKRYRHVYTIEELLGKGILFRVLSEGASVLRKKDYLPLLGFTSSYLVTYSLQGLTHTDKTRFGYALRGRKPGEGLLHSLGARMSGRNSLIVPAIKLEVLQEFFSQWKVGFQTTRINIPTEKSNLVDNQQEHG